MQPRCQQESWRLTGDGVRRDEAQPRIRHRSDRSQSDLRAHTVVQDRHLAEESPVAQEAKTLALLPHLELSRHQHV